MTTTLRKVVFFLCSLTLNAGFQAVPVRSFCTSVKSGRKRNIPAFVPSPSLMQSISVPVSELEKDLTPAERSITSVVRNCGPAVVYVTSFSLASTRNPKRRKMTTAGPPRGREIGSGSGFQVAPGYICTNYHVIERAFSAQQAYSTTKRMLDEISGNATWIFPKTLVSAVKSIVTDSFYNEAPPEVYVRINSDSKYEKCRILEVEPDLDLAVLKVEQDATTDTTESKSIAFGSSSDLLVGQFVVAIGNPFALDKTVTTGVVSAVNREFRAGTARTPANTPIRNCIQTDAAINPGNSGGPLLNLKGDVVGINTAIVTTSGSNAGIGFAVPSDQIKPVVDRIIQNDQVQNASRRRNGWIGVSIIKSFQGTLSTPTKNWITEVVQGSPAANACISPLRIDPDGSIHFGDAIVAVSGNAVSNFNGIQKEFQNRVIGEQVALTLENGVGDKRVVQVMLVEKPT